MKTIKDHEELVNKKALLRLDLNVPIKNGVIIDETRINKILPVINFLLKKKSKVIIISHVGRPKGKVRSDLSLKPICQNLEKKINKKIRFFEQNILNLKKKDLFVSPYDQIVFLENIRFYKEEEINDIKFAKHLASLADLFINDAFSCSHRSHASVSRITEFLPSYAGLQFESEVRALKKITSEIRKPITCIVGGSKISSKIGIIKNLIPKFDFIIFIGAMANNILFYKGINVGKSIKESDSKKTIDYIFEASNNFSCEIIYPDDVVIGKNFDDKPQIKDLGPKTINKIDKIIQISETVFWNGPAGYFENPNFSVGSFKIAKLISKKTELGKIYSVVGGGDTISVINKINLFNNFSFVSTAGGAFLEYLEGQELPGIKALSYVRTT